MKLAEVSATLVVAIVACSFFTAAAAKLKIRKPVSDGLVLDFSNCGGTTSLSSSEPQAKSDIRAGIVVRITRSNEDLKNYFAGTGGRLRYVPEMEEMLGKDYVVVKMKNGDACLNSPDTQRPGLWCFPVEALQPWKETNSASEPPVAGQAMRVVGLPTKPTVGVAPPNRNDKPWHYHLKGAGMMDPISPPFQYHVDFEKTSMPLPPWGKVKRVVSIDCMDKLHKDPHYRCKDEDYVGHKETEATPAPDEKPLSKAEGEALKKQVRHLKSQIRSLLPAPKKNKLKALDHMPGVKIQNTSLNDAIEDADTKGPQDSGTMTMDIGREATVQRMNTAQSHGEKHGKMLRESVSDNLKMVSPVLAR